MGQKRVRNHHPDNATSGQTRAGHGGMMLMRSVAPPAPSPGFKKRQGRERGDKPLLATAGQAGPGGPSHFPLVPWQGVTKGKMEKITKQNK